MVVSPASSLTIVWPRLPNEDGDPTLWHGAWLVGHDGVEADGFYEGRGGKRIDYPVPTAATGIRIRRWPNEGLAPEYVDVIPVPAGKELPADSLDFDTRQPFSTLEVRLAQINEQERTRGIRYGTR